MTPNPSTESFKNVRDMITQVTVDQTHLTDNIEELPSNDETIASLDKEMLLLKATSSATLTCLEQCLNILQQQQMAPQGRPIEWLDPKNLPGSYGNRTISCPVSPAESFVSACDIPVSDHRNQ